MRLPIVEATAEELEAVRAMLVRHGLLAAGEAAAAGEGSTAGGPAEGSETPRAGRISGSASETPAPSAQAQHA